MRRAALLALLAAACSREPPPPAASAPAESAPAESPPAVAPAATAAPPATPAARAPDWGEPDMVKVRRLFERRFPEVKRCYEAALARDEGTRGKFVLRFTILPDGALAEVTAVRSTFRRREVPECVADVVRRWRTPFRPEEAVAVEYPLRFSPR